MIDIINNKNEQSNGRESQSIINKPIEFAIIPKTFNGTFISHNNRIMVWQNCVIYIGYVYLP